MSAAQSAWLRPEPRLLVLLLAFVPVAVRATEFPESADQPSAFVTVIEAREYDDRFETVEDVLAQVAGVRVRRFGPLGAYSTATIRGSKAEQVLVILDGVRLNSALRGEVDLSTLSLRTIERIEVRRGGGSSRYGSDAIGGVIVITSRQPEEETGFEFSTTAGSLETWAGDALFSHAGERLRGSLAYSRLRAENKFEFNLRPAVGSSQGQGVFAALDPEARHTRLNADFVNDTGMLSALWPTGDTSQLFSFVQLHRKDSGQPGAAEFVSQGSDEQVSCPYGSEQYRRAVVRLGWQERALGPGAFEAAAFYRYERHQLHDPRHLCDFLNAKLFPGQTRAGWKEHEAGLQLEYASRPRRLGPVFLVSRTAGTLQLAQVRAEDVESKRRWVGSLFAQEEVRALGGRLRLFPALGLNLADTSSGRARSAAFLDFADVSVDDETAVLPRIGAIVRLAPGLRLKSNYARSFRRPNFSELFHPDYGFIRGNPSLEPEESWDFDIGLELGRDSWGPLDDLRIEGAYFHRDIEQSIEWVQLGSFSMPINTGAARSRGYELSGSLRLLERIDLAGSYTVVDTEIRASGNPPTAQPA